MLQGRASLKEQKRFGCCLRTIDSQGNGHIDTRLNGADFVLKGVRHVMSGFCVMNSNEVDLVHSKSIMLSS